MKRLFTSHGRWAWTVLLCCGAACAAPQAGPTGLIRDYAAAVRANQPRAAYTLLDKELRQRVSRNAFIKRWRASRKELLAQARSLEAAILTPPTLAAEVTGTDGEKIQLVTEDGLWRVTRGISVDPPSRTPEAALKAFVDAVARRDYQSVMRVLAASWRKTIEHDLEDRLARLRDGLDRKVEVTGNRARLQYDRRYKIELIKENGSWKILDFD